MAGTKTHDYTRHGTITLFAALSYLDGKVFGQTAPRHTHRQWLAFLKHLDAETPADLTLHLVIDNYATHKHPKVKSWIAYRNRLQRKAHGCERIVLHFTPTSSSWINLVERFFRDLTEDAVRDDSFASVDELLRAIEGYLAKRNLTPSVTSGKPLAATFSSKSTAPAPPVCPIFSIEIYRTSH